MKRLVLFIVAIFITSTVVLADGVTHSYLVGTRRAARESISRIRSESVDAGRNVEAFDIVNAYRADLTADEALALRKSPEVAYVEEDLPLHAFSVPGRILGNELRNVNSQTIPYGVKLVDAPLVWPVSHGNGVNVAVLDTGIDLTHPDLQAAYAGGVNEFFGDSKYPNEPRDPIDDEGHGTHVAGTIAATDNSVGVVGVAPAVRLWSVRVLRSDGNGSATGPTSKIAAGIQWVVQQKQASGGKWIISMSLGSCQPSATLSSAVSSAVNAGVLVVAAAGNHDPKSADVCDTADDNAYHVSYPAAYPGVIAVAAVDSSSKIADFSNFGPEVAVAAPGVGVLSTVRLGTGSLTSVTTSGGALNAVALTGSPTGTFSASFVDCGLGLAASDFPASVRGNIALIKRGSATFAAKVKNAQTAGAAAVIIYNNDDSGLGFTLTGNPADDGHVWPLTVAVSLKDGQGLLAQPTTVTITNTADDYDNLDGTSMATPHVAGVAALVWSVAPSATATNVRDALIATARDLGDAGFDQNYGNGLVDAFLAAKQLAPAAFAIHGRNPGRRGH